MGINYFAVDIGGTAVKYAIVSPTFEIMEKNEFPTPYTGVQTLLEALMGVAQPYLSQIAGIGVSVPGVVEEEKDYIIRNGGAITYLDGVAFGKLLDKTFHLPYAVENDGKAAALGEYAVGALHNTRCGVVIVLGTGIGGGIVLDGKLWKGTHLFAGEFSYLYSNPVVWPDNQCFWGCTGGASALKNRVLMAKGLPMETELTGYDIFQAANQGDQVILECIRDFAHQIAVQICNLQAILDPDIFAIGGGISRQPLLLQLIEEELYHLEAHMPPFMRAPHPKVVASISGNDANLIGAAYHCAAHMKDFQ